MAMAEEMGNHHAWSDDNVLVERHGLERVIAVGDEMGHRGGGGRGGGRGGFRGGRGGFRGRGGFGRHGRHFRHHGDQGFIEPWGYYDYPYPSYDPWASRPVMLVDEEELPEDVQVVGGQMSFGRGRQAPGVEIMGAAILKQAAHDLALARAIRAWHNAEHERSKSRKEVPEEEIEAAEAAGGIEMDALGRTCGMGGMGDDVIAIPHDVYRKSVWKLAMKLCGGKAPTTRCLYLAQKQVNAMMKAQGARVGIPGGRPARMTR